MDTFDRLMEGYARFRETTFAENEALYRELAEHGQSPKAMVISCCDSRADPGTVFGAGPGTLFVVRNVASLVPPYEPEGDYHGTSAALEFAVTGLGVHHVLVMGHARCGGVQAFREGAHEDPESAGTFIGKWMSIMKPAQGLAGRNGDPAVAQRRLEQAAVAISLDNLMTFPFVQERVEAGTLLLHGAWFDIGKGLLHLYREDDRSFQPVDGGAADAPAG